MTKKLLISFHNRSLRSKILLMNALFCTIIITFFTLSFYKIMSHFLYEEMKENRLIVLERYADDFNKDLYEAIAPLYTMTFNNKFTQLAEGKIGTYDEWDEIQILSRIFSPINAQPGIQMKVFFNFDRIYTKNSYRYHNLSDAQNYKWSEPVINKPLYIYWTTPYIDSYGVQPSRRIISAVRAIPMLENSSIKYIICMDLDVVLLFRENMLKLSEILHGESYIIDEAGIVCCCAKYSELGKNITEIAGFSSYNVDIANTQTNDDFLFLRKDIEVPGWKLVIRSSLEEYNNKRKSILIITLCSISSMSLILVFMDDAWSRKISKRMTQILDSFTQDQQVKSLKMTTNNRDEISKLLSVFLEMSSEKQAMTNTISTIELQKKELQLSLMHERINPHFLYNQLDIIYWMAVKSGQSQISKAIMFLAKYYRHRLSEGEEIVTIGKELENIINYIELINIEGNADISYSITCPEEVKRCLICKNLLEPIVENAIKHGIKAKDNRQGDLKIHVERKNGQIQITLQDDGVGITTEMMERLNSGKKASNNGSGYGFWNVNQRIKTCFGESFGAQVVSNIKGTTVILKLPEVQ